MDQDFHYYGTFYAARLAGFDSKRATLIGKASNFIDFLSEQAYSGYWRLVRNKKTTAWDQYTVVGEVTSPRYTFQGTLSTGVSAEDGLWCSYHFTPGNYPDPRGIPTPADLHGKSVAERLPKPPTNNRGQFHTVRTTPGLTDTNKAKLLNRPMSPLSRAILDDAIACATDPGRLRAILKHSVGGWEILSDNAQVAKDNLDRFNSILLGVRAHVIADTWAHQDWSGIADDMNTYWDVGGSGWGRQSIDYQDVGGDWKNVVLSSMSNESLQAAPNVAKIGHGWMGHFPDYSFAKYRYKPAWRSKNDEPHVRDNPEQYRYAFLELCSLFKRALGGWFNPQSVQDSLDSAQEAISTPCELANKQVCPRVHSAQQWMKHMAGLGMPDDIIDTKKEPDPKAVLGGLIEKTSASSYSRYGSIVVNAMSDLYLFQIAADYHFHFVQHFLKSHQILKFSGSWSSQLGPVAPTISDLF